MRAASAAATRLPPADQLLDLGVGLAVAAGRRQLALELARVRREGVRRVQEVLDQRLRVAPAAAAATAGGRSRRAGASATPRALLDTAAARHRAGGAVVRRR